MEGKILFVRVLLLLALFIVNEAQEKERTKRIKRPNIIFILTDDMGWGDVPWADIPEIPMPNLAKLKKKGVELTQTYAQSKCTPSRAAFLTGRYPWKYGAGTQDVFTRYKNNSLPRNMKLLPAYLKDLGYSTHMAGKWHLGFCSKHDIPTAKGFDSFYGSWTNTQDYYHHTVDGYDWNYNDRPAFSANGTYNTFLIVSYTQKMLTKHFTKKKTRKTPFFGYVAFLAPHKPLMVPEEYITKTDCNLLKDKRRTYCGMLAAVDEGIGNITKTLKDLGQLDDTIIIFTSDNGGSDRISASNWPHRGSKQTPYEGGTHVRTVMSSRKYLKKVPAEFNGLIHFTDFLPTLYQAAKGKLKDLPGDLDGISFWKKLRRNKPTDRHWMVYDLDSNNHKMVIRLKNKTHDFKLVYWKKERVSGWAGEGDRRILDAGVLQRRYDSPPDFYRLFNMATNPLEFEPNATYPDAALQFPEVKKELQKKLKQLAKEEVVPNFGEIPVTGSGRPWNNKGAYGPGCCDM